MAFRTNNYQQLSLMDEFNNLSPRTKKIVENSWAKDFADIVFPAINEERFAVLYSRNKASRSNTPVNFIIGALMIKTMMGQSDDEMLESICCDIRYKYALHTTSYEEQPISDRTFSRFRERLYVYQQETGEDLLGDEMKHLASIYQKFLNLHSNIRRMDSMMVASSAKHMSRLEILYSVNANAVLLMHELGADEQIPAQLSHYLSPDDRNDVVYYCKDDEVTDRLTTVIQEAELLRSAMDSDQWLEFSQYQLLIRVLKEQTEKDENDVRTAKNKKEISPSSLQNPSDPDATFRTKAGKGHKGYTANIVETVGEEGVSLITDFDFQQNSYSDSQFCKDQIERHSAQEERLTLIADGAYGSNENQKLAEEHNVNLITTALTGKNTDEVFARFEFNEAGTEVLKCPAGFTPEKNTFYQKTGMCRIIMKKSYCSGCPNKDRCKAKLQHKTCAVTVSLKMARRAAYIQKLHTEEYMKLTRMRNAVEGIPSVMRRKYHVDHSPFRGLIRTGWTFALSIGAYNITKLLKHLPRTGEKCAKNLAIC